MTHSTARTILPKNPELILMVTEMVPGLPHIKRTRARINLMPTKKAHFFLRRP